MGFLQNVAKYGGFGLVGKMFSDTGEANKSLESLISLDPTRPANPYAAKQLGLATSLFNSRMTGAPQLERNIQTTQANQNYNIDRTATDASQALSAKALSQGTTDQAFSNLQTEEAQNKYNLLGNLNKAYQAMSDEQQAAFEDQVRKFGDYTQIKGAQTANKANLTKSLTNLLFSVASLGMSGGMGGGNMNLFQPNSSSSNNGTLNGWVR